MQVKKKKEKKKKQQLFDQREVSEGEERRGGEGGQNPVWSELAREKKLEEIDREGLLCQRQSSCSHLAIISSTLTLP